MSETNGTHTSKATLEQIREETRRARALSRLRQAQVEAELWESSNLGMGWGPGWADLMDPFANRRDDFSQMYLPNGAGQLYGRQDGRNRPFIWTDIDLDRSRSMSRWLATRNPFAIGILSTIRNYLVKRGYTWEVHPTPGMEDDPRAAQLARRCQKIIDEFSDLNSLASRERSSCWRAVRDGEVFVRLFAQEDGRTLVRFVEPEQVREQPGADSNCAFGIETESGDVERPLAYHVTYDGTEFDCVPASEMCHLKRNVDECVKRGLSDFYATQDALDGVYKLLRNMREAGAVQAAIAWIEQFESSTQSQVASHIGAVKDLNRPNIQGPVSGRQIDYQRFEPGTIVKVGKGKQYLAAPLAGNTSNHVTIAQACLRALGVRWGIPEHMISGDASNNNYACHDSETELLTRRGWLQYDQIRHDDLAATMNQQTGMFEWQPIQAIHIHDYSGELVCFKGRDFNMLVTPNHRMYAARHQNRRISGKMSRIGLKPFEFVPADRIRDAHIFPLALQPQVCQRVETFEIPGIRHERYYKCESSHPQTIAVSMDAFLCFLGWWISEGWTAYDGAYHVGLSQSEKQVAECENIRCSLAKLPWHVREYTSNSGMVSWMLADKSLYSWLRENCGTGSHSKCLPDFVFDLPAEQQQILLQAMLLGDGHHWKNGSACYYTVSRKLIDQLQILALQCGYISNEILPMTDQGGSRKFVLSIRMPGRAIKVSTRHISRVQHDGKVWCVTVGNGLIVTRRGGKAIVTGNSILVTGSPFVNAIECDQDDFGRFFLRWRWIALRIACESGRLPGYTFADIQDLVDIHYTPPQVAVSNESEQATIDHQDIAAGVMSIQTRRARRGLDDDQEERNLAEKPPTRVQGKFTDLDSEGNPITSGSEEGGDPDQGLVDESLFPTIADLTEAQKREKGEVWKGPSGRYFTVNQNGRVVPAKNPGAGEKKDSGGSKKADKPTKADPAEIKSRIEQMRKGGKVSAEDAKSLADSLMGLTTAQLTQLKKDLGLKASGAKAELAKKLAERALATAGVGKEKEKDQGRDEGREEGSKGEVKAADRQPEPASAKQPKPPQEGYTGTDTLGRKWQNGNLAGETEALPAQATHFDATRKLDVKNTFGVEIETLQPGELEVLKQSSGLAANPHLLGATKIYVFGDSPVLKKLADRGLLDSIGKLTTKGRLAYLNATGHTLRSGQLRPPLTKAHVAVWTSLYAGATFEQRQAMCNHLGINASDAADPAQFRQQIESQALEQINGSMQANIRGNQSATSRVTELSNLETADSVRATWKATGQKWKAANEEYMALISKPTKSRKDWAEIEKARKNADLLEQECQKASKTYFGHKDEVTKQVKRLLAQPEGKAIHVSLGSQADDVSPVARESCTSAVEWVNGIVARAAAADHLPAANVSSEKEGYRACYSSETRTIHATADCSKSTAVHELGHHIEHHLPGVAAAAHAFLAYRTRGEKLQPLNKLIGPGYRDDEAGKKDNFDLAMGDTGAYVGKSYGGLATEIVSMGLEKLYTDPQDFAAKDPEYCAFMIGILDGSLRYKELPDG